MKALSIIILSGLVIVVLGLFLWEKSAPAEVLVPAEPAPVFQSLKEIPPVIEGTNSPATEVRVAEQPVEIQTPVQPLEERGDALLFEAEALQGSPFDRAITMPFD